jgi:hypothetical protein
MPFRDEVAEDGLIWTGRSNIGAEPRAQTSIGNSVSSGSYALNGRAGRDLESPRIAAGKFCMRRGRFTRTEVLTGRFTHT